MRFLIRFDPWYSVLSWAVLIPPARCFVDVEDDRVVVHMAWAFRARFARAAVAKTSTLARNPVSRGVHGFAGRWLVNGAGDRILTMDLAPDQRAYVLGLPVTLRQLAVSVDDPAALAAALEHA